MGNLFSPFSHVNPIYHLPAFEINLLAGQLPTSLAPSHLCVTWWGAARRGVSSLWCLHLLPHTTAPRSVSLPGAVLLDRSSADVAGWEGRTKLIDQAETSRFGYSCLKRPGLFGGVRSVFPTPVLDLSLYHVVAGLPTAHPPACTIVSVCSREKLSGPYMLSAG